MGVVDFPRDAQGRIIVHPPTETAPEAAPPAAARPVRALDPGAHVSMDLPGAPVETAEPGAPSFTPRQLAGAAALALLVAAALIVLITRATPAPAAGPLAQSTIAPPATTQPTASPEPTPFGAPLNAAIVAYFDYQRPDTATALENGTRVQPIARIGQAWVLLALADGGEVWVRWGDLPSPTLADLPDRAPAAAPPPTAPPAEPQDIAAPQQPGPASGAPAPCDEASATYRVAQEVPPYGRVLGLSCVSLDEAAARAGALAAELRATSEARP